MKSTAAKNLSEVSAHISKLTEAAWIQDVRTAGHRQERTRALFRDYAGAVDAILMLRTFRSDAKITVRTIQLAACTVHAEWIRK